MLAAGLLLLAAQVAPQDPADTARTALIDSEGTLQALEYCLSERPSAALSATRALRARHNALRAEATGLLPYIGENVGYLLPPVRCHGRRDREVGPATAAVNRFAAAVAARRAAMRGLWIGPMHLCGGAVLSVGAGQDEQDRDRILIRFSPAMAATLASETSQRVGKALPVLLDGRTLTAPIVNEPILGGEVSIAGGEPLAGLDGGADAFRAAAARPCTP